MLLDKGAVPVFGLIDWHIAMAHLQSGIVKHHPYQSVWWQWVIDQRAIWYLYEKDGAQRGIMLIGNPFIMLAGLPALVWCLCGHGARDAAGRTRRCWRWRLWGDAGAVAGGRQAGAVLLPLSAAGHLSGGGAGADAGRAVAVGA
jgi:hypothetical protein